MSPSRATMWSSPSSMTDRTGKAIAEQAVARRLACVGECMIELHQPDAADPTRLHRTFGGDTLNTAVYAARVAAAGALPVAVEYITALGTDPFSDDMLAAWRAEGVGTGDVVRLPDRLPGLYLIRTDAAGERGFHYWRDAAAARAMFDPPHGDRIAAVLAGGVDLYVSGITLAILPAIDRLRLLWLMAAARASGCLVAFDANVRPRLWPDGDDARRTLEAAMAASSLVLTGLEDDCALYGGAPDAPGRAADAAARVRALGVGEVVVKGGSRGVHLDVGGAVAVHPAEPVDTPVDTTAAGDSFNGAYLVARLAGRTPDAAVALGQAVAARVIRHRGAIVPTEALDGLAV